jgi:predicted TIM-barrel enzyme
MNSIEHAFGLPRVLLPVIHPVTREAALTSIRVVVEARCRGIFLIDQGMEEADVLRLVNDVRLLHPTLWIGVNLLHRRPAEALVQAFNHCGRIDGIWSDDALIDERRPEATTDAQELVDARKDLGPFGWSGLYFGGVAFKYRRPIPAEHLSRAALLAAPYVDVVCTSGPGTGMAIDTEKLTTLHQALGVKSLALASGVTVDNALGFLPYVHAFLVGTGIESSLGVIDGDKVRKLRGLIEGAA